MRNIGVKGGWRALFSRYIVERGIAEEMYQAAAEKL
jgi:hypothetical protein